MKKLLLCILSTLFFVQCSENDLENDSIVDISPDIEELPTVNVVNMHTGAENTFCEGKEFAVFLGNGLSNSLEDFKIDWSFSPGEIKYSGSEYNIIVQAPLTSDTVIVVANLKSVTDSTLRARIIKVVTESNTGCDNIPI